MIKDEPFIIEKSEVIEINYGKRFPFRKNKVAFAMVFFIIIVMLLPSDSYAYVVLIPICLIVLLVMITATTGLKIDLNKSKYKYYFSVFGISVGKWKNWSGFRCLVLKSSNKKVDRALVREFVSLDNYTERLKTTEIYMMDSSHRKKILCGSFDTYKEAKEFAQEISRIMNYPIQKFSPKRIERKRR